MPERRRKYTPEFKDEAARRLIQGGAIDLVRHLLSCNDHPSIKIAE